MTPQNTPMDVTTDAYRRARKQVRALRGWYRHALVYAAVIGGLWLLHGLGVGPRVGHAGAMLWPLAPMLGWGLGVAIHGLSVWSRVGRAGRDWEERKIAELMQRG